MSYNHSYTKWATFDVEKELKRVDEVEEREIQQKQQQKQIQVKESIERSVAHAAEQSAAIFAAQAAVAALKAKNTKTRKGKAVNQEIVAIVDDVEIEKAATLQTRANVFALKHELLQRILENRRLGDSIVTQEQTNWHEAKRLYQNALDATKKLEEVVPVLLQMEEEQDQLLGATTALQEIKCPVSGQKRGFKCRNKGHESGSRDDKQACKKSEEILPKANDLVAIITMFYKDIYVGIGTCDFKEERFAEATEAFKEVLLRDDGHLTSWLKRGEAFEKMDAPLLAMLHYNRITNLDAKHEMGSKALARVKTKLLVEGEAPNGDNNKFKSAISACTEGRTLKEVLERVQLVFQEACVLAVESFFYYSTTRFQVVLGCLEALRTRPEVTNKDVVLPALRDLEISCHLNIASGCLEMQRNYAMGITHCQQVFLLDSNSVIAYFRMGQLYHALHNYKKALECYEMAKVVLPVTVSGVTEGRHEKMLSTIVKATDKCEFDRNQYDIDYLQSLAAKKSVDQ
ncbi:unnamed protein product [Peronospora belbahrii]|uniref:peptidylprolyl isomerase n=1 Tax=Peronospora belbahrii TaxID=622444 RepID=A0AAU9KP31_9STRA|nr:unnamed protein product [Peronospora belbahrii]CAH0518601.1 unnamed protein product [Peronospora belbahrii]